MTLRDLLPMALRVRIADLRGRGIYSHYADRWRCIFIHIPKTGGISVARALFGQAFWHATWLDYYRANPRKYKRYFKFAFVRNPWDRLVSAFFYLRAGGRNDMDRRWADEHLAGYGSFREFVLDLPRRPELLEWVHFRPQCDFICDRRGRIMVDFVGRFERLESDYLLIAQRLGVNEQLDRFNASRRGPYATYYDSETRQVVARLYWRDLALFGYQFNGDLSYR